VRTAAKWVAGKRHLRSAERGFTLVETMVSMFVLTVGLLSLLGVMGMAMARTEGAQQLAISKQLANEALESILTARETANVQWSLIQNTGAGGIFLSGFNPIYQPGADGIIDTADDAAAGYQTLILPGPDGIYGTADDQVLPLSNYQRQVQIAQANDNLGNPIAGLRAVTITIQYFPPGFKVAQNYVMTTFVSAYR